MVWSKLCEIWSHEEQIDLSHTEGDRSVLKQYTTNKLEMSYFEILSFLCGLNVVVIFAPRPSSSRTLSEMAILSKHCSLI